MYQLLGCMCLIWLVAAVNAECSIGCKNNDCHYDGRCRNGCTPGYKTDFWQYCNTCNIGYSRNNGRCCPNSCISCVSDTYCSKCIKNRFGKKCTLSCSSTCGWQWATCTFIDHNGNVYCSKCPTHCTSCKQGYSGVTCEQCSNGWYRYYGICYECPRHCSACTSSTSCTACEEGHSGVTCTQCSDGWYPWHWLCYRCHSHCLACTSSSSCTACKEGYEGATCAQCSTGWYKDYNGGCYQCPDRCLSCTSTSCNSCTVGYYGQNCQTACSFGCTECKKTSGKCLHSCKAGFQGDLCNQCVVGKWGEYCDNDCSLGCTGTCDNHTGHCSTCKTGFSGNMCCVQNNNCKRCSSNTTCNSCVQGFRGHDCEYRCPKQCASSCDQETGLCDDCNKGFFGLLCDQVCSDNCIECDRNGSCIECTPGLFGSFCDRLCPVNCKTCTGKNSCGTCQNGYFGTVCRKACPENCVACTSNTECSICKEGYTGRSGCLDPCSSVCRSCTITSSYECIKCNQGRYDTDWDNNISNCHRECSKNCLQDGCDERTGICTVGCIAGYAGDKCECPENCQNQCYTRTGNCYNCPNEYIGDKCSCITHNERCNEMICESCSNNTWYRSENSCCKCNGSCRNNQCLDSNTCSNGCIDGYYGVGCTKRCSQRDSSCLVCNNEACSQCATGFYPSNVTDSPNQCIFCPQYCVNRNCSTLNGTCLEGCAKGYFGERCNNRCGKYCKDCDRYTGVCNICETGRFSRNCSKNCSTDCLVDEDQMVCDIDNGQCELGCIRDTLHGVFCDMMCNKTCKEHTCDWKHGKCLKGCIQNYFGKWCEHNCSETCTENQPDRKCSDVNGFCITGCQPGYYGHRCEFECGTNCVNMTCERYGGTCVYGCNSGYVGKSCTKVFDHDEFGYTGMITGTASGISAFVVSLVLIVCIVMHIRQRRKTDTLKSSSESEGTNDIALDNIAPTYNNAPTSVSVDSTTVEHRANAAPKAETPAYVNHIIIRKSQGIEKGQDDLGSDIESRHENMVLRLENRRRDTLAIHMEETEETIIKGKRQPVNDTYYNAEAIDRKGVTVDQLADYVATKSKADLVKEFLSIPNGLTRPYADSQRRENISRNRFKGVYSYDANRVKIRATRSDYINASYIDGFHKARAYIAALGPTDTTTDTFVTFWTMVWQENVEKIVMLTNLVENMKMKCDQYWPNVGTGSKYGDVKVVSMAEEQYPEFIVRKFSVTKDSEKRMLYHFHYTAWPDKSVPDNAVGLLEFRNKVLATMSSLEGPVVVHCSAGIGRTGTYIALDYLNKEGEETGSVDISSCFANLRAQRVCMIQAEEQYIYLHDALVHNLTFDSKPIPKESFQDYLKALDADSLQTKFAKLDYEAAKDVWESTAITRNSTYINKNHPRADIPGDRYRPKLYMSRTFGDSDYISVVYLDSFRAKNHYVVTQTPLKETTEDFFTLLFQDRITCVVDMQPNSPNERGIIEYLPTDNQISKHGCFDIQIVKVESNEDFILRRLVLRNNSKSNPELLTIHHYQYMGWDHHLAVPPSPANYISFVNEVEAKAKQEFDNGKILLHCISGAERSCLFSAVSVMLQKMKNEEEVSLVNVVRQIRSRRTKAIPTKEQYLFCHQCVGAFLDTFHIYSNFAVRQ